MSSHQQNSAKAYASNAQTSTPITLGKKASLAVVIGLGLMLVYGAGIAMPAALHNAAHDTRHAIGFPCH